MTANDADVTNDNTRDPWTAEAGPIRIDSSNDIPVLSDPVAMVKSGIAIGKDGQWSELGGIASNVGSVAANAVVAAADPLNFLISAGLTFLIDVVQPLEDGLAYVTGHPEKMDEIIQNWQRVTAALQPLSEEIRTAGNQGLIRWEGLAAQAAKDRINKFADGVDGLRNDTSQLTFMFAIAKVLIEAAQGIVIGLMATFIEWLIFTWLPAIAAAVPTFGASMAAASSVTVATTGRVLLQLQKFIIWVAKILMKLRRVLYRLKFMKMRRAQANFQMRNGRGFSGGFINPMQGLAKSLKDWRTYAGTAFKLPGNAAKETTNAAGNSSDHDTSGLDPSQ